MRIAVFVAAGLVVLTSFLHAQSDDDDDDETDYFPLVPTGSSLRFGLRYVGGPKVAFHDVGGIPPTVDTPGASDISYHSYNDGYVGPATSTYTDSAGHPRNDGLTNNWQANFAGQVVTDTTPFNPSNLSSNQGIAFHTYTTTSETSGHLVNGKTTDASGWELQVGRSLGKIARKVDVSLVVGFSFSGFRSKNSGDVTSLLTTLTDVYSLSGLDAPTSFPATFPTSDTQTVYDSNGQPKLTPTGGNVTVTTDNSTTLALNPTRTVSTTNADGTPSKVDVTGLWQIKGAYYTISLGPVFQFPITERFKFSVGFGPAAMLVGSTYTANERAFIEDVSTMLEYGGTKTHTVLLPAWFANADAEYWLTERTGLYLGATYQKSQGISQTLGNRTATIDLGTTSGLTSGLTMRF